MKPDNLEEFPSALLKKTRNIQTKVYNNPILIKYAVTTWLSLAKHTCTTDDQAS